MLSCNWEIAIANLVGLCCKRGIAGVEVEYLVVKDFCEKHELDVIDTYSVTKRVALVVYSKD